MTPLTRYFSRLTLVVPTRTSACQVVIAGDSGVVVVGTSDVVIDGSAGVDEFQRRAMIGCGVNTGGKILTGGRTPSQSDGNGTDD